MLQNNFCSTSEKFRSDTGLNLDMSLRGLWVGNECNTESNLGGSEMKLDQYMRIISAVRGQWILTMRGRGLQAG